MFDKIVVVVCIVICVAAGAWGWWWEIGTEKKVDDQTDRKHKNDKNSK